MTVDQMVAELRLRLEDSGDKEFSTTVKMNALNHAQDRLVSVIDDKYLTELEIIEKWSDTTNEPKMVQGVFNLSNLQHTTLFGSNGIKNVKLYNGKYMNRIGQEEAKQFDSTMVVTDLQDPYYIIFADRMEIIPPTNQAVIPLEVYYMKTPSDLIAGGTCELNDGLHFTLIFLAEAYCWMNSEEYSRGKEAERIAMEQITVLNAKAQTEGV